MLEAFINELKQEGKKSKSNGKQGGGKIAYHSIILTSDDFIAHNAGTNAVCKWIT